MIEASTFEELDEQTLEELDAIPEVSLDDLRIRVLAYRVGARIMSREFSVTVEEDE